MRAVTFFEYGDPEVLQVRELPKPTPLAGEILIQSAATPVNPADVWFREGGIANLMNEAPFPYVPGLEVAGIVAAAGPETSFTIGDRVTAVSTFVGTGLGTQAEYVVVNAHDVARVPDSMSLSLASTLPMNALTALAAVESLSAPSGELVAIIGAAGQVGRTALQLAQQRGYPTLAIAAKKDLADLEKLGATYVQDRDAEPKTPEHLSVRFAIDCAAIGSEALLWINTSPGQLVHLRPFELPPLADLRQIERALISVRKYQGDTDRLTALINDFAQHALQARPFQELRPEAVAEAHKELSQGGMQYRHVLRWE